MRISPEPPEPVRRPVMFQNWESLTFFHWPYDPRIVRRFVPDDLDLDLFDGAAWISLAPFLITGMRPPYMPSLPWLSVFPETNVRTYVIGPDGYPAIWFFSLDAARLHAVIGARTTYGLPYMWSRMEVLRRRPQLRYAARRIWPHPKARYDIQVTPGRLFSPSELGELDHFLTARFRLYSRIAGRLAYAQIDHPPWPLASVRVDELRQSMIEAAGFPSPSGAPLVHYSEFIKVRIDRPRFIEEYHREDIAARHGDM